MAIPRLVSLAALVAVLAGCNDDDSPGSEPTVALYGIVTWVAPPSPPDTTTWTAEGYAEGVEICQRGTSSCATTDPNGSYRLEGLPADAEIAVVVNHPDAGPFLGQLVTEGSDLEYEFGMVKTEHSSPWVATAGCEPPGASTGAIFVRPPPGSYIVITPAPPTDIVYTGADGLFDPSLTEVPADTPPDLAGSIACDVAPGDYQVDVEQTTGVCRGNEGWPGDGHDLRVIVEGGSVSIINWWCE